MKKLYLILIAFLVQLSAAGQDIVFTDANFKAKLLEANPTNYIAGDIDGHYIAIDSNSDNEIQYSEALAVYSLSISSIAVTAIDGIENFTNLHGLTMDMPNITALPISNLTQLISLYFSLNTSISLVDLEHLTLLENMQLFGPGFTSINLQNLSLLKNFQCHNTLLTDINFCGTIVNYVWFPNNPLLESVNFKNNVIGTISGRSISNGPPPLPNYWFENCPAINHICYDEGEYDAVSYTLSAQLSTIVFTTDCDSDCLLGTATFNQNEISTLYPNPADNSITVENKNENIASIALYNTIGQLVKTIVNPTLSKKVEIPIMELQTGSYFLIINSDKEKTTKHFIKL